MEFIIPPSGKKERDQFIEYIKSKPLNKTYKASFIAPREVKTLSQNAYIFLICTHIGQEVGCNKMDMYFHYLKKFPTYKEITINGEIELVPISLSSFSKEQASEFIDSIVTDAVMEGYEVPEIGSQEAVNMYNYYKDKNLI